MYNDTAAREGFAAALLALSHTQDLSETLCHQTRVLVIVITLLAMVFVALRFLGRWRQGVRFGADDWTCLVALTLLYANFIIHLVCMLPFDTIARRFGSSLPGGGVRSNMCCV